MAWGLHKCTQGGQQGLGARRGPFQLPGIPPFPVPPSSLSPPSTMSGSPPPDAPLPPPPGISAPVYTISNSRLTTAGSSLQPQFPSVSTMCSLVTLSWLQCGNQSRCRELRI